MKSLFAVVVLSLTLGTALAALSEEEKSVCEELSATLQSKKEELQRREDGLSELEKLYFEMCFSHGGGMSQECMQMGKMINDFRMQNFKLIDDIEKIEKRIEQECQE